MQYMLVQTHGGEELVRSERFELPTPWFEAKYSIQLSYDRTKKRKNPRASQRAKDKAQGEERAASTPPTRQRRPWAFEALSERLFPDLEGIAKLISLVCRARQHSLSRFCQELQAALECPHPVLGLQAPRHPCG